MNPLLRAGSTGLRLALSTLALALAAPPARAQDAGERGVSNPPALELRRQSIPMARVPAPKPGEAVAAGVGARAVQAVMEPTDEASLDLNIVFTKGKIWNPSTQRFDVVNLRSYQGTRVDPNAPFVSPLLEIAPGDTIRMKLNNKLPADPTCLHEGDINVPHCLNGTNMHAHGLWVNPAGNGDNVLISINPSVSFEYEYNVPSDHPAGTFWYHTHRHGSTALQVASGMAGALIIRGNRPPTPASTGDLDTLLKPTATQPFKERVVVLQQIQYACRDGAGAIKTNPDKTYKCDPTDTGEVSAYDQLNNWRGSGRYTSINGVVLPTFDGVKAGDIERWRVIHGGVRDSINLEFRKLKSGSRSPQALSAAEQDAFVGEACTGDPLPQHLVAADGLTIAAALKSTTTVLQPGYRWDALMVFPEAGTYCVIDGAAPPAASLEGALTSRQLLGLVNVAAGRAVPADLTFYLASELVAAAATNVPADVRTKVTGDLRMGLKLASYLPHPDIAEKELTPKTGQTMTFGYNGKNFTVDNAAFDPANKPRLLRLGDVEQWTLVSDSGSHPFHVHVNPFQVVSILDPNGKDVSTADAVDNADGKGVDPQYRGLKGVWKDTLWVKAVTMPDGKPGKYTLTVRTRYERYIGDYVLHCHILGHEDTGMMQLVRVGLPDGAGGTLGAAH